MPDLDLYRGTTPTLELQIIDDSTTPETVLDMSTWTNYLSLKSGRVLITLGNSRMTFKQDNSIEVTLTQEETLSLSEGLIRIQMRSIKDGSAPITNIFDTTMNEIIQEGVITEANQNGV